MKVAVIALLCWFSLVTTLWAQSGLQEMVQLANVIFAGQGKEEMVEWENFTMQLMPEMDPVDIAALFREGSPVGEEQREQAKTLFLQSQGLAALERGGKSLTDFLQSKGFTMSYYEHRYNPALMFEKPGEASRRFDFVRRGGQLKLARVSLQKP